MSGNGTTKKRWIGSCLITMILLLTGVRAATVPVARSGRKIMHDGFLMEWSIETAQPWKADSSWIWDAMRTPEGLCGYVRLYKKVACSGWTVTFSIAGDKKDSIRIPGDSVSPVDWIKTDYSSYDSAGIAVLEWVVPWSGNEGGEDSLAVVINGKCDSGEQLPELRLTCRRSDPKNGGFGRLAGRGIIIGILAVIYLMVKRRIRNQTAQKGSPHQSA
jgi:hypothetical protein